MKFSDQHQLSGSLLELTVNGILSKQIITTKQFVATVKSLVERNYSFKV